MNNSLYPMIFKRKSIDRKIQSHMKRYYFIYDASSFCVLRSMINAITHTGI